MELSIFANARGWNPKDDKLGKEREWVAGACKRFFGTYSIFVNTHVGCNMSYSTLISSRRMKEAKKKKVLKACS